MDYESALELAYNTPTHDENKELKERYLFFKENRYRYFTCFAEKPTAANIFKCLKPHYLKATRLYIKRLPTYREDGNLKKMRYWEKKLMFHRAWQRSDVEVKEVDFEIVGIKRQTTHLPPAVLIQNVSFLIEGRWKNPFW